MSLEISGGCDVFEEHINACLFNTVFFSLYCEYLSCKESVVVILLDMSYESYFSLFNNVSR